MSALIDVVEFHHPRLSAGHPLSGPSVHQTSQKWRSVVAQVGDIGRRIPMHTDDRRRWVVGRWLERAGVLEYEHAAVQHELQVLALLTRS